jgi:hypothetical protein
VTDLKYFSVDEFACKHTGENHIDLNFVARLDELREKCGFPFAITSGYRSAEHPEEAKKSQAGNPQLRYSRRHKGNKWVATRYNRQERARDGL